MPTIAIRLSPRRLQNADLDIRYALPDRLIKAAGNIAIQDDGYDYGTNSDSLILFLRTQSLTKALPVVVDFIRQRTVLGNRLSRCGIVVATASKASEHSADYTVVYPPSHTRPFSLA